MLHLSHVSQQKKLLISKNVEAVSGFSFLNSAEGLTSVSTEVNHCSEHLCDIRASL